MKYILTGLSLLLSLSGFSQDSRFVYYFDQDFNLVAKSKSLFNGIGVFHGGTLEFNLYDNLTKSLLSTEHYTDSSLAIENGLFQTFFKDATLASEGSYVKGVREGLWMRWDSAGHTIDSSIYSNGNKMLEVHTGYYSNGKTDSLIINNVNANLLNKTFYNDKGQLVSEAAFIGQNGIVKYYDSTRKVTIDTATSRLEIEASFPGGEQAWTAYVGNELQKNADRLQDAGVSGTCRIKFIVRKDGTITNVEPITMKGTKLAKIAVNIISRGARWNPASQYGRYVNAFREQPITFQIQGR